MPTPYEAQILEARYRELILLAEQQKALDRILLQLHRDISKTLLDISDGTDLVRPARLRALQVEIQRMVDGAVDGIRDNIARGMAQSIEYGVDARMKGAMAFLYEAAPDMAASVPLNFATVNSDAVKAVLSRTYGTEKVFSDRIWDFRKYTQNTISETLTKGIIEGKSAVNLSKDLEPFLVMSDDEMKAFARKWAETHDTAWKADWKTRGRLKYNARRLARTEINNAFREGAVQSAKRAPWVRGLKWNLSSSHPEVDICDDWASADDDGLGLHPAGGIL